jgi:sugar phosphate isomerase/epimerase
MKITRRAFGLLMASSMLSKAIARTHERGELLLPGVPGPLGLELYSFRQQMSKDLPAALALTSKLGFTEVEVPQLYNLSAREFRSALDQAHLACTAMVANDAMLKAGVPGVSQDARTLGASYVIYPWIAHPAAGFSVEDCVRAAAMFNRWGEQFHAEGLQFCYHPHGYEFGPGPDGTLLDTLIRQTNPQTVHYQMDVFWFAWPGQNPIPYLRAYPGRFPLMHLKDLGKSLKGNQTGIAPGSASVALGAGRVNFTAIFAAAIKAGVKRYYIEDESPLASRQVPESLEYLRSLPKSD